MKAISVKKQIIGSEINEDIAYLYNELAVTYQGSEKIDMAIKCIKKELAIFEGLNKTESVEYVDSLSLLAELHRAAGNTKEVISTLSKAISTEEALIAKKHEGASRLIDLVPNLRNLAEEQIK